MAVRERPEVTVIKVAVIDGYRVTKVDGQNVLIDGNRVTKIGCQSVLIDGIRETKGGGGQRVTIDDG
jgi:hypothetical protein